MFIEPIPNLAELDARICVHGVVAGKVQAQKHRHRLARVGGQVKEQVHFGTVLPA
jgi:hypothetical protein